MAKKKVQMDKATAMVLLEKMMQARKFEEKVQHYFSLGMIHGTTHLGIGEEATSAGTCVALEQLDDMFATHRGHGSAISKGIDLNGMMAEIFGKETGVCRGKGGSMHIADKTMGVLGANGILGPSLPLACGAALAHKKMGENKVAVAFFGDGASNEGACHEAMNLAAAWGLPVLFVCTNNTYGMSTHISKSMKNTNIADRAIGYGMKAVTVDGNDVRAVYETVKEMRQYAHENSEPVLIVQNTYRISGHSKSDGNLYRTKDEINAWKEKCPIKRWKAELVAEGIATQEEIEALDELTTKQIDDAVQYAIDSPYPELAQVYEAVYAETDESYLDTPKSTNLVEMTYANAIKEAISEEMRKDSDVFMLGEDIGVYRGAFGVSGGMVDEFGEDRIMDTPIAETGFVGAAIGAAVSGMRPIVEIMFSDFMAVCWDMILNQAPKMHYMFGGKVSVPMVLRTPSGGGTGAAAQHSQSLEAMLAHIPGLKVVIPSTPEDAKGLLKSAIRENNPVMFLEQKLLYRTKGMVPEGEYYIPLGVADVKREGTDCTIVTYGRMTHMCLAAAETLAAEGKNVEVIDLRTIMPLDKECIINSVKKTKHLVIVHEAVKTGGVGGEITGIIAESEAFNYLDAPIVRLASADVPVPFCPILEKGILPDEVKIAQAVRDVLA